ncbi:MAG: ABC transporter permease [Microcoleaceae cyanobacterium]
MKGTTRKIGGRQFFTDQLSIKLSLLTTLVRRDLDARYKGSILGNLWPLLNQLVQLLIYIYVFSIVLQVKLDIQGMPQDSQLTFGLWLFAGLVPWFAFTNGLTQASTSVVTQPNLVKKVVFPLGLLPLVPIFSAFIESLFGLILLITTVVLSSQTLNQTLWLLPLVWLSQLLLTAGLGYWTAGLTVFLRDIPQSLGVVLNLWFYLTPIVYPLSKIPQSWQVWISWLNPLTAIVETYRDLVLVGEIQHGGELATASIAAIILFSSGLWFYRRLRPAFADVL